MNCENCENLNFEVFEFLKESAKTVMFQNPIFKTSIDLEFKVTDKNVTLRFQSDAWTFGQSEAVCSESNWDEKYP